MFTPQEVSEKTFPKSSSFSSGYDLAAVDEFLDTLTEDYTALYKENAALKTKMRVLVDKIEEYRTVDEEMRKALYNAQVAAKDTVTRAQCEADRILQIGFEEDMKAIVKLLPKKRQTMLFSATQDKNVEGLARLSLSVVHASVC